MNIFTTTTQSSLNLTLTALLAGALLSGCVVHSDGGSDLDTYEEEQVVRTYDERYESEEYEEYEEYEETTVTTTTTTTTTDELDVPPREPRPLSPYLFEESFEDQLVFSGGRMPVEHLSRWMIEWSELSACEGSRLVPTVELQSDEVDLNQGEVEGAQHVRLDSPCGPDFSPVSITTSLDGITAATRLRFYARAADSIDALGAGLTVIWGDEIVMDEPLVDVWMEYEIDLTQYRPRHEAILSLMATGAGVIIDHVRID